MKNKIIKFSKETFIIILKGYILWCLIMTTAALIAYFMDKTTYNSRITALEHEVATTKQRQLDLITYNDCMACHPQERRCENINGMIWEVER